MELEKYVNSQKSELRKAIKWINKNQTNLPDARVKIRKKRKTYSLAAITGGRKENVNRKEQFISLSRSDAELFATKHYLDKVISPIKKELAVLEAFSNDYKPNEKFEVISSLPPEIRNLVRYPLLSTQSKAEKWASARYRTNPTPFDERTVYKTVKGDRVRSRAELIIANNLYSLNIPYRYEMAYSCGNSVLYPDFTVMNPLTGEIFYVEYFGLMEDDSYRSNTLWKIREYYKTPDAGRFIFIFESESISMDTDAMMNVILLRMGLTE